MPRSGHCALRYTTPDWLLVALVVGVLAFAAVVQ
jgi:hypothetical protein